MIDVEVEEAAWAAVSEVEALVRRAAEAALASAYHSPFPLDGGKVGIGGAAAGSPSGAHVGSDANPARRLDAVDAPPSPTLPPSRGKGGELSFGLVILLTDDAAVRDLNARFRGKDAATNVLSFPASSNPQRHLGDIALAYGVCAREADEQGKRLAHHLQHLVVHGVLHLLGYDHMSDDEAEAMEGLERLVMAGLGAPDPYDPGERDHDRPRPLE